MTPHVALENPHDRGLAPSRLSRKVQYLFLAGFLVALCLSTLFALTEHWRRASFVLGASLLWLSVVRLTCDSKVLGVLSVRSRRFDATFTGAVGAAIVFLATSVDPLGS
ncbi:DUF3017 domain-containing protein [Corynebacterium vitaeruminis]|uniref:DUF3017 domain-containing protein n=1 Tax=Corynebacterium vitaeruminis DSM 20294 TaxID=1224164 RepID=W5Y638_9CORY|nr:DUF3017 domain-containing protein [Corynebacterium vitaeruminis]AHI21948.1 hypothetical protein B843_02785 [Corynebacterium vitaeruminis DSM 20294]